MESGGSKIGQSLTWEEVAVSIGIRRRGEGVLAMFKHGAGIGGCEAAQLGVEILEDRGRLPMSQGMDGSLVDAQDEEGSGAPRAEAVGFDPVRGDVSDVVDGGGSMAEFGGDVLGHNIVEPAGGVEVAIEGRVGEGVDS